ncbi:MAG TPA: DUF4097 family beta strand repeat-containing protein [Terriglobales bacterium]|nr:DUF4097 family beta strand repeat-containing protein [Terriglobales bacterium]
MPTFDTPQPISVSVEIGVGDIRIAAGDRSDTVVEVRPSDSARKGDVELAAQTRVELAGGRLLVRAPRGWRYYSPWGGRESIDVEIALPAGSHVQADAAVAALHASGRLGDCRFKTSFGDIQLEHAAAVQLSTAAGDVSVDRVGGRAEVSTGSGAVRMGAVEGGGTIKNSNGATWVGAAGADLRVKAANGEIAVERALASVDARSSNGVIRLDEVVRGLVVAETAAGRVEIGIGDGVAAYLDLDTKFGVIRNDLDVAGPPQPDAETVEVHVRTAFGDVVIHRSFARHTLEEEA